MIPPGWADLPFWTTDWPRIETALAADPRVILPPAPHRFAALAMTPPASVRVVILGQDPYHTPGVAMGLAFSVAREVEKFPPSLVNIFKELRDDLDVMHEGGDLSDWAAQGVLLLNTALTVPAHHPGGHKAHGWSRLATQIIDLVSQRPTAFVLWGQPAQAMARHIRPGPHLVLTAPHPSPLSAYRGFFGSQPFSRVNRWLADRQERPILWGRPPA